MQSRLTILVIAFVPIALAAQNGPQPPTELPTTAVARLASSLAAARTHPTHIWRDMQARNSDETVNAYIEIPRGDRRKWEYEMRINGRALDRVMPEDVGGYPINYGYVPQTISYDGDPFDVLVLGPALPGGRAVRGIPVGLLRMEDEKGLDSKVVLSPVDDAGRPTHALTAGEQRQVGDYFRRYKQHEPGKFSKVAGWGNAADGLAFVSIAHTFFRECRQRVDRPCRVVRPR